MYLSTVKVISIKRLKCGIYSLQGFNVFVHDMERAGIAKTEWPAQGKNINPGKVGIKEVTGHVKILVSPAQLQHVTPSAGIKRKVHNNQARLLK